MMEEEFHKMDDLEFLRLLASELRFLSIVQTTEVNRRQYELYSERVNVIANRLQMKVVR